MHVLITGGTGFIGRKLAAALLERDEVSALTVFDVVDPPAPLPDDPRLELRTGDLTDAATVGALLRPDTGAVFHLAAVVSGGAEADFDLGYAVNLHGTLHLLEAVRRLGTAPRLVFTSSVAVYGGEMPEVLDDRQQLTPQTSYGVQKAIGELLICDYSRKGFLDGRSLRLPTIVVRPGKPNKAASSFASSILREPLQGEDVVCPVQPDTGVWLLSPRKVVEALLRAHDLPADAWPPGRAVALPGRTFSVGEMIAALRDVAGERVAARVRFVPDPVIERIVYGWPVRFAAQRAQAMGFTADDDMRSIIAGFVEDELDGRYVD